MTSLMEKVFDFRLLLFYAVQYTFKYFFLILYLLIRASPNNIFEKFIEIRLSITYVFEELLFTRTSSNNCSKNCINFMS